MTSLLFDSQDSQTSENLNYTQETNESKHIVTLMTERRLRFN